MFEKGYTGVGAFHGLELFRGFTIKECETGIHQTVLLISKDLDR
jgi:hypothetical protein